MEKRDKVAVYEHLMSFKQRGIVQFDKVLTIPTEDRIPALIQQKDGMQRIAAVLTASLNSALSNINVRVGLNEDQVIEIAALIIDQSHEDNLSLEDVLLFLQELSTGRAGKIYDRMDIPTFFELFEVYRQDRHESMRNIRYEQDVNHKSQGPTERVSEDVDRNEHRSALNDYLKEIYKK